MCQVPVKAHVGKHGPNNCLGQSFTETFQSLLSEINQLKRSFEVEHAESRDREVRLLRKIDDLGRQLDAARNQFDRLSMDIEEFQRREVQSQAGQKSAAQVDYVVDPTQRSRSTKKRHRKKKSDSDSSLVKRSECVSGESPGLDSVASNGVDPASSNDEDKGQLEEEGSGPWEIVGQRRQPSVVSHSAGTIRSASFATATTTPRFQHPTCENASYCNLLSSPDLERKTSTNIKRAVFFFGNLRRDTPDNGLADFVTARANDIGVPVTVFNSKLFRKDDGRCSGRVTVDVDAATTVGDRSFWPKVVYVGPWKFDQHISQPAAEQAPLSAVDSAPVDPGLPPLEGQPQ